MINTMTMKGPSGGEKKESGRDRICNEIALEFIRLDFSRGFTPIEIKPDAIQLEKYSPDYTRVEYRRYMGTPKNMEKLILLAKAHRVAATAA